MSDGHEIAYAIGAIALSVASIRRHIHHIDIELAQIAVLQTAPSYTPRAKAELVVRHLKQCHDALAAIEGVAAGDV